MVAGFAIAHLPQPERAEMIFGGKKKTEDPVKRAKQRKKVLAIEQEIADLQLKKANAADNRGSGEGGDNFWATWYGKDWDW